MRWDAISRKQTGYNHLVRGDCTVANVPSRAPLMNVIVAVLTIIWLFPDNVVWDTVVLGVAIIVTAIVSLSHERLHTHLYHAAHP